MAGAPCHSITRPIREQDWPCFRRLWTKLEICHTPNVAVEGFPLECHNVY